jgi:predicted  nucleic acid-binding Zn-ribbon protein
MVRLKDQIKNLLELQDVDNHLTALVQEKEEAPKRIAELEARQAKQEGLLAAAKAEQAELNGRRLDLERKIEENTRNTRRSQNKANEVKNTRQHKAILKELEDLKLLKDECENALLEVLGSQEAINPKVEEIGRALEETVKGLAQEKA